jgi:hypothetical protein
MDPTWPGIGGLRFAKVKDVPAYARRSDYRKLLRNPSIIGGSPFPYVIHLQHSG